MKRVLVFLAVVVLCGSAFAAVGDSWSLSGDMSSAANPNGQWTYHSGGAPYTASVDGSLVGVVNGEVPDAGTGWYNPGANWIMLVKFSVDANPIPPFGTGDDKTNFLAGSVGGHANTGATWTAAEAGTYQIDYLGYNARNQLTAVDHEKGRMTSLRLRVNGVILDDKLITGGIEDGIANAYTNSIVVDLLAGDTVDLAQEGADWSGLDMTITLIPEPATLALLAIGSLVAIRRRK